MKDICDWVKSPLHDQTIPWTIYSILGRNVNLALADDDSQWVIWMIVGGKEIDKSDRREPRYSAENNVNKHGVVTSRQVDIAVQAMTATD